MEKEERLFTLKFVGEDDFSRPVFKDIDRPLYFGSTEVLVPDRKLGINTAEDVVNFFNLHPHLLEYFGSSRNCEPHGGRASNWKFKIIHT